MAISRCEYAILHELHKSGVLPRKPHVLDLGEANWYGDVTAQELYDDIRRLADPERRGQILEQLVETLQRRGEFRLFEVARICYKALLDYASYTAVDLNGTQEALRLDLNLPIRLDRRFDVVINGGTGEHVFDVCQFFRTVHEWTAPGGMMIHGMPFTGPVDHGFYNFQPTFYWDLAAANGYDIVQLVHAELDPFRLLRIESREQILRMARDQDLGRSAGLHAVFRKAAAERPFTIPLQGYYAGLLSAEARLAWEHER